MNEYNIIHSYGRMIMNKVIYYSGTGNSLAVSREIASKLDGGKVEPIDASRNCDKETIDTLGIVFPIHSLGLPQKVMTCINAMDLSNVKYIYSIATMGGSYGVAFLQLKELLAKKGVKLSASFAISSLSNSNLFIKIPGVEPMPELDEQSKIWENVVKQISIIVDHIKKRDEIHVKDLSFGLKIISKMASNSFIKNLPKFDKQFYAKECKNCGLCSDSCPERNIEINTSGPVWLSNCNGCLRCFNICPENRIRYGKMEDPRMLTQYRKNIDLVSSIQK